MFVATRLVLIMALTIPQIVFAEYDPEKLKQMISDNQELFHVSDWQRDKSTQTWNAKTTKKWMSIAINDQQTEIISPFINPKQIAVAKKRCLELATTAMSLENPQEKKSISKLLDRATQHHNLKHSEKNNVRFEVRPKLVGAFVRLFCRVKTAQR